MENHRNRRKSYIWVHNAEKREYLCPASSVKRPSHPSDGELRQCIDVTALQEAYDGL